MNNTCQNGASCRDEINYYVCECVPGYNGTFCENDIDECLVFQDCRNGATCTDLVNDFNCTCAPGYNGSLCENDIDECELYRACQNGASCSDQVADYNCDCLPTFNGIQYGGKNCTYVFTACDNVTCSNRGTCIPELVNEARGEEKYTCRCDPGYTGAECDLETTASFDKVSRINQFSNNSHDNKISFRFRTTLPSAILFGWQGTTYISSRMFVTAELVNGQLTISYVKANPTNTVVYHFDPQVNDAQWHGVVITQSPNLTLSVQLISSHCTSGSNECFKQHQYNDNSPVNVIWFGSVQTEFRINNTQSKNPLVGCMQDITINGNVLSQPFGTDAINVMAGCPRTDQCPAQDPCNSKGTCSDLWVDYKCTCSRPYLGRNCLKGKLDLAVIFPRRKTLCEGNCSPQANDPDLILINVYTKDELY